MTFVRATQIVPDQYYILVDGSGKVAIPIAENYTYGYLYVEDPVSTSSDGKITTTAANAIYFGSADGGYTMKDSYGRYLGMDDNDAHKSFQLYTASNSGCVWTMSLNASSQLTATNNLRSGFTVRYVSNFSNFSPSTNTGDALPTLYVLDDGSQPNPGPTPTPTPEPGDGDGTAEKPYSVGQVQGGATGSGVWVTGYIVGWIDGKSISEGAKFDAAATANTNILLAPSADVKDLSKCIPIQLKNNLRDEVGLKTNPGNLGKEITIKGDLQAYFGTAGLKETSAYAWGPTGTGGGDTPTPTPTPDPGTQEGDGTQANPFTVADVLAINPQSTTDVAADNQKGAWVTGYIVGYYAEYDCHFTAEGAVNLNVLLGGTPSADSKATTICVQLPNKNDVRAQLNLLDNPAMLGQKVSVKGDILKYNTMPGVKNTSAFTK